MNLKPYTDRWKPEAVTSKVKKIKTSGILELYYETTRFRFPNMVRKVDAAKLQNLNLKVKTLDLKPYTDRWKPEAVTSEVKK